MLYTVRGPFHANTLLALKLLLSFSSSLGVGVGHPLQMEFSQPSSPGMLQRDAEKYMWLRVSSGHQERPCYKVLLVAMKKVPIGRARTCLQKVQGKTVILSLLMSVTYMDVTPYSTEKVTFDAAETLKLAKIFGPFFSF